MKVIYDRLPSKRKKCVVTIGVFDGIHRGHQFILNHVRRQAQKREIASLAITFDIPPQLFLEKKYHPRIKTIPGCIVDLATQRHLISELGIDYLWVLKTNLTLLKCSGREFIEFLLQHFDMEKIIVGQDFRYGYHGQQTVKDLQQMGKTYGFQVSVIKKRIYKRRVISSTLIRELIRNGKFETVKDFLGRYYCMKGKVVKGMGIGKTLGFPTVNLDTGKYILPQNGIYAGYAVIGKQRYLAAIYIGTRPTVTTSKRVVVEAYIIKFNRNICGKTVHLLFLERLHDDHQFPNPQILKQSIQKDVKNVRIHHHLISHQ